MPHSHYKKNSCCAVATNSESCNGAVRRMVQVQKFFLPHHNSLLLEVNKCVHNVSEDGLKERDASKHSRQIFRKKKKKFLLQTMEENIVHKPK